MGTCAVKSPVILKDTSSPAEMSAGCSNPCSRALRRAGLGAAAPQGVSSVP